MTQLSKKEHTIIVGPSGAGKHLHATQHLVQQLVAHKHAVVFDCGRSYVGLVQSLGGRMVRYAGAAGFEVQSYGTLPLTLFELGDVIEKVSVDALPHLPAPTAGHFVLLDESVAVAKRCQGLWGWLKVAVDARADICCVVQAPDDAESPRLPTDARILRVSDFRLTDGGPDQTNANLFRHTDGGLYQRQAVAKHTDNLEELVVYEHLWPFESDHPWARPLSQWESRFTPISVQELTDAMKQDREQAQRDVTLAKAARRQAAALRGEV